MLAIWPVVKIDMPILSALTLSLTSQIRKVAQQTAVGIQASLRAEPRRLLSLFVSFSSFASFAFFLFLLLPLLPPSSSSSFFFCYCRCCCTTPYRCRFQKSGRCTITPRATTWSSVSRKAMSSLCLRSAMKIGACGVLCTCLCVDVWGLYSLFFACVSVFDFSLCTPSLSLSPTTYRQPKKQTNKGGKENWTERKASSLQNTLNTLQRGFIPPVRKGLVTARQRPPAQMPTAATMTAATQTQRLINNPQIQICHRHQHHSSFMQPILRTLHRRPSSTCHRASRTWQRYGCCFCCTSCCCKQHVVCVSVCVFVCVCVHVCLSLSLSLALSVCVCVLPFLLTQPSALYGTIRQSRCTTQKQNMRWEVGTRQASTNSRERSPISRKRCSPQSTLLPC